ncbi:hypothetical protein, partial [Mesorhizobium sp.]|uniref:hypothetical protein n=1 Tax=Mesorhizobium sp. TaxID=1871066 RepID=UPI0025D00400
MSEKFCSKRGSGGAAGQTYDLNRNKLSNFSILNWQPWPSDQPIASGATFAQRKSLANAGVSAATPNVWRMANNCWRQLGQVELLRTLLPEPDKGCEIRMPIFLV